MKKVMMALVLGLMSTTLMLAATPAEQTVKCGQQVRLTPQPAAGYEFSHWQDDVNNHDNPRMVTIDENTSVYDYVAVFVQSTYTIEAAAQAPTMGYVSSSSQSGHLGDEVSFTAEANSQCYVFDHWEDAAGNTIGTTATITITIAQSETIYAVFSEADITITAGGTNGSVTIEVL